MEKSSLKKQDVVNEVKEKPKLTKCKKCKGKGAYLKLSIKEAKQKMTVCEDCKGVGFEQPDEYNGFRITPVEGTPNWIGWYVKNERVANMFVLIRAFGKNPNDPNKYLTVAIHSMFTDSKHRRCGYMNSIVGSLKNMHNKFVKFMYTNYHDSTAEGRAFFKKRGFVREGDVLIWRRDGKK